MSNHTHFRTSDETVRLSTNKDRAQTEIKYLGMNLVVPGQNK